MRETGYEQHITGDGTGTQEITKEPKSQFVRVKPEGGDVRYSFGSTPTSSSGSGTLVADGKSELLFDRYWTADWYIPTGVILHVNGLSEFHPVS